MGCRRNEDYHKGYPHQETCNCRGVSRSTDGGTTFGPSIPDPALVGPVCPTPDTTCDHCTSFGLFIARRLEPALTRHCSPCTSHRSVKQPWSQWLCLQNKSLAVTVSKEVSAAVAHLQGGQSFMPTLDTVQTKSPNPPLLDGRPAPSAEVLTAVKRGRYVGGAPQGLRTSRAGGESMRLGWSQRTAS
jgi:hypothetical protein